MSKSIKSLISLFVGLLIGYALISQRYTVTDWWKLRNYKPAPVIASMADAASLSDKGRKIFYVNNPELKPKTNFRSFCDIAEQSIVLGCYLSTQNIYILDVTDDRLEGVEQVTAAHEMLHAAWDRLSNSDKKKLTKLLYTEEAKLTDQRIKDTLASYRQSGGESIIPNEMHSIFGTELRNLSPELEQHYKQYFKSRSVVVALAESYAAAFTEREAKIAEFDTELNNLKAEIDKFEVELKSQSASLDAEYQNMLSLRQSNPSLYNSKVNEFNLQVRSYNQQAGKADKLVEEYNQIVEQRNAIAGEEKELIQAIDTRATSL